MQERVTLNGEYPEKNGDHRHQTQYGGLFRRFVLLTVICSLVPLLLVGWGFRFVTALSSGWEAISALRMKLVIERNFRCFCPSNRQWSSKKALHRAKRQA